MITRAGTTTTIIMIMVFFTRAGWEASVHQVNCAARRRLFYRLSVTRYTKFVSVEFYIY